MPSNPAQSDAEQRPSRYVVGIDLGTTNSAMAYVDTDAEGRRVRVFAIPQIVAPGVIEMHQTLPSFHYEAAEGEFPPGALRLPWDTEERRDVVGVFARDHGAMAPGRLIASAKSWISHSGVDRTADLLPWHGLPDVERLSPVAVSSRYLAHLRAAWDHAFPQHPLAAQDVVLTLPASFDEVARELTVKAAALAGLPRIVLLEEPQAAFYAWIDSQGDAWEQHVEAGQKILVCDIGGGTSDFTLIRVRRGEQEKVQFHRVAVGEHLILGGDNLDLALAHHLERRIAGEGQLAPRQWGVLVQTCRRAKEELLGAAPPPRTTINLPGTGARVIGGGLQVEVTREEVHEVLVEGFLPQVKLEDKPAVRRSGFQEFGLPYATDHAITRYLAAFLTAHGDEEPVARGQGPGVRGQGSGARDQGQIHGNEGPGARGQGPVGPDSARPDIVLFNGGLFESPALRARLLEVLRSWFSRPEAEEPWEPLVLRNDRLDLAVAQGAAYYGLVRRGIGVRISAGLARTYYVGVHDAEQAGPMALCLLPAGIEEGTGVDLERTFDLLIRQPVEFPLYYSSTRLTDPPGTLVPVDREQMSSLPPIRTVLQAGKKGAANAVAVQLHARLTEIGTLELWCGELDRGRRWRLQFDVRAATESDRSGHLGAGESAGFIDEATLESCRNLIRRTFARGGPKPEGLVKLLDEVAGMPRGEWPASLLRGLWETLMEVEAGRQLSVAHEARWLNLLGFCLRPGYGLAVDDWRVAQTWKLFQRKKLLHPSPMCRVEWLVLWRRIAGGLAAGQQRSLAEPLLAGVRPRIGSGARGRGPEISTGSHETAETWRLLGALELLPTATKVELGTLLLAWIARAESSAAPQAGGWTLGRLAARVPMYGPLNMVVPTEVVGAWARRLIELDIAEPMFQFAVVQMTRRTGDRHRDVSQKLRDAALEWLAAHEAPAHYLELVREGGELRGEEEGLVFGESLPRGLHLR